MSDDEAPRRGGPWLAVLGLGFLLSAGWWLRGQVLGDAATFKAFCGASHPGEPWQHVQDRAAEHGWGFVRQSREGQQPEEWLAEVDFWSYRAGCVVVLAKGRVVSTRFAELPKR